MKKGATKLNTSNSVIDHSPAQRGKLPHPGYKILSIFLVLDNLALFCPPDNLMAQSTKASNLYYLSIVIAFSQKCKSQHTYST